MLEIKSSFIRKNVSAINCIESCDYLVRESNNVILKKKHSYYAQVQLGLTILNIKECNLVIYASYDNTFINIIVNFDEPYTLNLVHVLQQKYVNMLYIICKNKHEILYLYFFFLSKIKRNCYC